MSVGFTRVPSELGMTSICLPETGSTIGIRLLGVTTGWTSSNCLPDTGSTIGSLLLGVVGTGVRWTPTLASGALPTETPAEAVGCWSSSGKSRLGGGCRRVGEFFAAVDDGDTASTVEESFWGVVGAGTAVSCLTSSCLVLCSSVCKAVSSCFGRARHTSSPVRPRPPRPLEPLGVAPAAGVAGAGDSTGKGEAPAVAISFLEFEAFDCLSDPRLDGVTGSLASLPSLPSLAS